MTPYDDYDEEEDYDDEFDRWEHDCGLFEDGGFYFCGGVGSEDCEFQCPYNRLIGTPVDAPATAPGGTDSEEE